MDAKTPAFVPVLPMPENPSEHDTRLKEDFNNPHFKELAKKPSVYLYWDHSTVKWTIERSTKVKSIANDYGCINNSAVYGMDLCTTKPATIRFAQELHHNSPLLPKGHTIYEHVITDISLNLLEHFHLRHVHPIVIIIVSEADKFLRYFYGLSKFPSIKSVLIGQKFRDNKSDPYHQI